MLKKLRNLWTKLCAWAGNDFGPCPQCGHPMKDYHNTGYWICGNCGHLD